MRTKINGCHVTHVNTETGEIICETKGCTEIKDHSLTDKENNKREYMDSHVLDFNNGEKFVKLYDKTIPILRKKLSPTEFTFVISLSEFVSYEDCILRKTHHGNSHILDMKELSELLDMDYNVVRRIVSSLKKKGVIGKHETGSILDDTDSRISKVYTVNPYIYFRGQNINKSVLSFYNNSGWKEILDKDIEK